MFQGWVLEKLLSSYRALTDRVGWVSGVYCRVIVETIDKGLVCKRGLNGWSRTGFWRIL